MSDVIGLGTDIVDVARLRAAIERTPTLVDRLFADDEQAYAREARDPAERYAARFAAKEAALKALGLGIGGMTMRDIVVVRAESGAPSLELRGAAADVAAEHGVSQWLLSLSHAGGIATATAIALR